MIIPAPDGSVTASGKSGLREALQGFLDLGGTVSLLGSTAFEHGDIALTHSHWRMDIPNADPMEATTAEIVRRQADGSWKYILDNPWGGGVLHATA
jgi:ketosteroid isomerase-like protein